MAKKDLFKIDNYLIRFGILFLVIGLISTFADPRTYNELMVTKDGHSFTFDNFNGRSLDEVQQELGSTAQITVIEKPVIRPAIAISGLLLLIIGIVIRKKENKIISIWDALEKTTEGKVRDMEVSLGLSRAFILENLKHINAQQGAYYVYVSAKDVIVDGKLIEEHVVSLTCSGCGNNINKKASLAHLDELACSYCGAAIPVNDLTKLRSDILKENEDAQTAARAQSGEMSIPVFIILLIFFWPAAVVYYLVKKGSSVKKTAASMVNLENFTQESFSKLQSDVLGSKS